MTRKIALHWWVAVIVLAVALGVWPSRAQQSQDQAQQNQNQDQAGQQKKKKRGRFSSLRALTGESSEQSEATRTAGSKSVGEGQKIANVAPTAADQQALDAMENYSVSTADLKKFQVDGHLQPKQ